MKSYKKSLCAMVLAMFVVTFCTVGLTGCCSTNYPGGGSFFGGEPEYYGPQTMKEFMDQPRVDANLQPAH